MKTTQTNNHFTVCFESISKINVLNSEEIETQLLEIAEHEENILTLDLSNINFIDSSGFHVLLNVYKTSRINNSTLELKNLSVDLIELFKLIELNQYFNIN